MQKESTNPSRRDDVIQSVARFLSALWLEGEFKYQPGYLTEIFENILATEIGNDLDLRTKMISCIRTSKMLSEALEPFSDQEIEKACIKIIDA